jgi:DNA-directed RNA polymerase subunit RPC12/RpoP
MKKNHSWIYITIVLIPIIIVIGFVAIQFWISNSRGPVETNWSKVKTTMLANNDIEKIVVVNDKKANIYIKQDRLKNYDQEFSGNFSKPSDTGPHFTFNIGSVETFERNLREAQGNSVDEIVPEYREERNWAGGILWTAGSIILIFFILIAYFIPTFIAKGKENFWKIVILNIFTGWTVLGWIGALFWAISSNKIQTIYTHICIKCGYKYEINQKVKLFVCPNCNTENKLIEI